MLESNRHASEMNTMAEDGAGSDEVTHEMVSAKVADKVSASNTFGLRVRRVDAQNLPPIDTSLQIHDVCGESNEATHNTALIINKSHKLIKIGFSDLSYTVKTGIWRRSEYLLSKFIYLSI